MADDCQKAKEVCRFWATRSRDSHCIQERLGDFFGKIPGAVDAEQQPEESEEFAWLIDETIQQRITAISLADRRLTELNNYKLRERTKAIAQTKRLDEARMERWRLWLKWTFGNLHRASNRITFFYLLWTPLVMFYSAVAFMGMPTAVLCDKPNGICHNMRVLSLEARKTLTLPQRLWEGANKK